MSDKQQIEEFKGQPTEEAFHLRSLSYSYPEIAKILKITPLQAYHCVMRKLKSLQVDFQIASKNVLYLELERLDIMQRALWSKVENGDVSAINTSLKIIERRAKMLGLDAPEKLETTMAVKTYVGISLDEWKAHKKTKELETEELSSKVAEELEGENGHDS